VAAVAVCRGIHQPSSQGAQEEERSPKGSENEKLYRPQEKTSLYVRPYETLMLNLLGWAWALALLLPALAAALRVAADSLMADG
jgi:hypothetical protein